MAQWQMTYMRPQDIIVNPQVRKEYDPKEQEELNASVKALGVLMALLVMPSRVLLAGHRRLIAALAAGLETIPVIITDRVLSDSEIRVIQLTENMHRADLKPIEQVEGVEEIARLNPEKTNKELAKLLGFEASMITRLRSVSKVTPSVREAFAAGRIGLSTVYAISKCESAADQEQMLAQALSGASRDAIEQAGRRSRKEKSAKDEAGKTAKVHCLLPSGVQITVSGKGLSLGSAIDALTDAIKEMRAAKANGYTAKTFAASMKDKAKAKQEKANATENEMEG
jgi:ParB family chromosome partitioning protein